MVCDIIVWRLLQPSAKCILNRGNGCLCLVCMSCYACAFAKLGVYECRRRGPRQLRCEPGHLPSMQDQGYMGLTTAPTSKQTANSRDLDINTTVANDHIPQARHPRITAKSPGVISNNP